MKVIIVGGGVGGLTLALMLHARGIDCELFEQADTIRELGVGINTLPHAIKELKELGLLPRLDAVAIRTHELIYTNRLGQEIWREARGRAAGYDHPQFSIHRGELQLCLLAKVKERLGPQRVHEGHAFTGLAQSADRVAARFTRRTDGHTVEVLSDVLVGADGIHSAVRRVLYPQGDQPRFSGRMLWRAVTEAGPYMDGRSMFMAGHQDQKFVAYPISEPLRREGRAPARGLAAAPRGTRGPRLAPGGREWDD